MANNETRIIISGEDKTAAAFASVKSGLASITNSYATLTGVMTAGVIGGTIAMIKHSIDLGDELNDLSKKYGASVETLAGFTLAANQSGTSMEAIAKGLGKLSVQLTDSPEKFNALGISTKSATDAIIQMADIFKNMPEGAERTALAISLFGKAGADLIPLLAEGSAGMQKMIQTGGELARITKENAGMSDEFNDNMAIMKAASAGAGMAMTSHLLPALTEISKAMAQAAKDGGTLQAIWVGLGGLGAALFTDEFADAKTKISGLSAELGSLMRHKEKVKGGGLVQKLLYGSETDIDARIAATKKQIADLTASLNKPADAKSEKPGKDEETKALQSSCVLRGGRWAGGKCVMPEAGDKSGQIAKAQLGYDLSRIKADSETLTGNFSNAEKIMEAMRAAGLINERAYYDSKLGFLTLNSQAQESELQKEIDRMRQEDLIGKDRLENSKKIVEAQSKLDKVRADNIAGLQVNSIQEIAANQRVAQSYRDSEDAAQSYLDVIRKSQASELAGMGAGGLERSRTGGRAQIEDKYIQERRDLEKSRRDAEFKGTFGADEQQKYNEELDRIKRFQSAALREYDIYFSEILKKENDWSVGAGEALQNYADQSRKVAAQTEQAFTNAFKVNENSLASFVKTGKMDFSSLADSIINDLIRIQIRENVTGPLAAIMKSGISGMFGGIASSGSYAANNWLASAKGNVFDSPGLSAYSGRVVSSPTLFPFARGIGLMGEAGPEAIMPLKRGPDGSLGVASSGGGGSTYNVSVAVDARGGKVQGDSSQAAELGRRIESAVRGVLLTEKRPGGMLA